MLWIPVFVGAGILAYFALPVEPHLMTALLGLGCALGLAVAWRGGLYSVVIPGILVALASGFVAAKIRMDVVEAPVLQSRIANAAITGMIERVEPRDKGGQRVTLRVEAITGLEPERIPQRVRVTLGHGPVTFAAGQRIRVRASLSPPPGPAYPGGYDFARAAFFMGLGGVGFTREAPEMLVDAGTASAWDGARDRLSRLRQEIGARVMAVLPGQAGAIAVALITGERGGISEATNAAFRDSGLTHILSISGLHMTVMGGFVFFLIRTVLAAVPAIALRWPVKKWAAGAAALAVFGYLLISGASIATIRSWIMISIMFLAVLVDRPALALRNVALAALAILLVNPESVFDAGFQMSFAAVAALIAAYEALRERRLRDYRPRQRSLVAAGLLFFGSIIFATLIASIAVWPIGAFHFHKSQQFAVIANLLAVPICNVIIMPMALLVLVLLPFGLEAWPLSVMGLGITWMMWCADWVAALPGAVAAVPAMPPLAFGAMVIGGLWLILWCGTWRVSGLLVVGLGFVLLPTGVRPDVLVGRGGTTVAVRADDGRLAAIGQRGAYEIERWLERDGDRRNSADVIGHAPFRCDDLGCRASVKGRQVVLVRHPAAFRDDCGTADVMVVGIPGGHGCGGHGDKASAVVILQEHVQREGAHAIYFASGNIWVETVEAVRGRRPWSHSVGVRN